eukprot:4102141-Ditylum_brightwellii.AAC.1
MVLHKQKLQHLEVLCKYPMTALRCAIQITTLALGCDIQIQTTALESAIKVLHLSARTCFTKFDHLSRVQSIQ